MRPGNRTGDPYAPWWTHNIVVFDVETTGLQDDDRVVEMGFVRFERGEITDAFGTLLYPDREIPEEATGIHGISSLDVATAPRFTQPFTRIIPLLRDAYPAAYNASFDRRFWVSEMARTKLTDIHLPMFDPSVRWIDPLVWVRRDGGIWGGNKLVQACERYNVKLTNAHRATDDAEAAGKLLFALKADIGNMTITELVRRQDRYDEKQDEERAAWFRKKGIPYEKR
jgi:DNA polymerase-3 subunit epsilon